MLNHDFRKVQSTLARKVFDVPGNRVTLENDGSPSTCGNGLPVVVPS